MMVLNVGETPFTDSISSDISVGASVNSALQRSKSHSPQIFFKNRVVPSIPPSLVKFSLKLSSVMIGDGDSIPMSDHVPLEM